MASGRSSCVRMSSPIASLKANLAFCGFRIFTSPNDVYDTDDEQVRGVLRAMFASGVYDHPPEGFRQSRNFRTSRSRAQSAADGEHRPAERTTADCCRSTSRARSIRSLFSDRTCRGESNGQRQLHGGQDRAATAPRLASDALRNALGSSVVSQVNTPAEAANADLAIVFAGTGAAT